MRVDEFEFDLPEDRIALTAAEPRDSARLLHVRRAGLDDRNVGDLPGLLRPGDILVVNTTAVIKAQLTAERPARAHGGGGAVTVDVTLHKRLENAVGSVDWRAFVRPAKRVRVGDVLTFNGEAGAVLTAEVIDRMDAEATLRFLGDPAAFDAALERLGAPPLPPYIARKRDLTPDDAARYQTVYADEKGSVAAPTAGLHFTDRLLAAIADAGVARANLTLHVGAGTFLPVSADDTDDHVMHAEWGRITEAEADAINAARAKGGRVVAVGTTALRLLESAAKDNGEVVPFADETDIFITPGYRFKTVDVLMTNFHLPRSTLFMLVSAFAGIDAMKAAYAHAIANGYRFYSFGDACLLERNDGRN